MSGFDSIKLIAVKNRNYTCNLKYMDFLRIKTTTKQNRLLGKQFCDVFKLKILWHKSIPHMTDASMQFDAKQKS